MVNTQGRVPAKTRVHGKIRKHQGGFSMIPPFLLRALDCIQKEELEDRMDIEEAHKVLKESKDRIPYAKVRKQLKLK